MELLLECDARYQISSPAPTSRTRINSIPPPPRRLPTLPPPPPRICRRMPIRIPRGRILQPPLCLPPLRLIGLLPSTALFPQFFCSESVPGQGCRTVLPTSAR